MDKATESGLRVLIKDLLGMPSGSVRPRGNQPTDGDNIAILFVSELETNGWSGSGDDALQSGTATILIDFLGKNAKRNATQLKPAMQSAYAIEQMQELGLGFLHCNNVRDLTALELDQVDRYQVTMQLSYLTKYDKPDNIPNTDYIDKIPIGPSIDYPDAKGLIIEP